MKRIHVFSKSFRCLHGTIAYKNLHILQNTNIDLYYHFMS